MKELKSSVGSVYKQTGNYGRVIITMHLFIYFFFIRLVSIY